MSRIIVAAINEEPILTDNISLFVGYITNVSDYILYITKPITSQESEWSCICALAVSMLPLSLNLIFNFGIVPTVWNVLFFILILYMLACNLALVINSDETRLT